MKAFQQSILAWYSQNKRDLPWRKTDNPYKILVSEIMLQQTQVDRVIPKYLAFLKAFPTAKKLANAKPSQVITLWSGLGYNRRAIHLQKAAHAVQNKFPKENLESLPGIGPYTAKAVQAFAFHKDVPVIDTNIRRIFSRFFFKGKGSMNIIDKYVAKAVPKNKGTDWNNALMDLGALICTAASPKCAACPLSKACAAKKAGTQEHYLRIAPPQSKFEGSRRQIRGNILKVLKNTKNHSMSNELLVKKLNKNKKIIKEILNELEKEELLVQTKTRIRLP